MRDLQTELRAALVTWDLASEPLLTKRESDAIVKAARKYANPDYRAAGHRRYEMVAEATEGIPAFATEWPDLSEEERDEWIAEVKPYVDAALGVTEDAHKHEWVESLLEDGSVCQVGDCGAFRLSGVTEDE